MPALQSFRIVADDLSGAADCAAAFAAVDGAVPVFLDAAAARGERFAIDTDSRAMDAAHAVAATVNAFEQAGRGDATRLLYKKIDSTLRGHVGAELAAALRALPGCAGALVAPAFVQQGRTLVDGCLRVQGRPAENLGHRGDLVAMLQAAGLRTALLGAQGDATQLRARIAQALGGGAQAIVADAASEGHLATIAAAVLDGAAPPLLVAGSAGLAKALAAHGPRLDPGADAAPSAGPVLALVGSFSQAAAAQVLQVEAAGEAQVLALGPLQWTDAQHEDLRQDTIARARRELAAGRSVLLAIRGEVVPTLSRALVQAMAAAALPLLRAAGTCVLTGGDTARALFEQAGVRSIDVEGEFEPGISIARTASSPAPRFILKAGAFGDAQALQRIIGRFGRPATARDAAPTR